MKKILGIAGACIAMLATSSCTITHRDNVSPMAALYGQNQAWVAPAKAPSVELSRNNFRVTATQISGESKGFKLLGLIPFRAATDSEAMRNLYKNSGAEQPGRPNQVINIQQEYGTFYAILFSRPYVRMTGDVVEFVN